MKLTQFITNWVKKMIQRGEVSAVHVREGSNHTVAIGALRVFVFEEEPGVWAAQCIDLDYTASGASIDDVKRRFEEGLTATIKAHLRRFGNLDQFWRPPPSGEWVSTIGRGEGFMFATISEHEIQGIGEQEGMPFHRLEFINPQKAA